MTKISVEKAFRRKYIFPNAFHFSPQYDFDPEYIPIACHNRQKSYMQQSLCVLLFSPILEQL